MPRKKIQKPEKVTPIIEEKSNLMPVLFVGHGDPMNAIEENEFSRQWMFLGEELPRPKAILCISAHWLTEGTKITGATNPKTIHDFHGFPEELFDVRYPAPGSRQMVDEVLSLITSANVIVDHLWGFDHGCWSVLKKMFPEAKIPVLEFSMDFNLSPRDHYELAKELAPLREKEVLIIGSGNIVHNLDLMQLSNPGYEWAIEFDKMVKDNIILEDHQMLMSYSRWGRPARLSVPSNEHLLPLFYILALQKKDEPISFFNEKIFAGSISMTSLKIG